MQIWIDGKLHWTARKESRLPRVKILSRLPGLDVTLGCTVRFDRKSETGANGTSRFDAKVGCTAWNDSEVWIWTSGHPKWLWTLLCLWDNDGIWWLCPSLGLQRQRTTRARRLAMAAFACPSHVCNYPELDSTDLRMAINLSLCTRVCLQRC